MDRIFGEVYELVLQDQCLKCVILVHGNAPVFEALLSCFSIAVNCTIDF